MSIRKTDTFSNDETLLEALRKREDNAWKHLYKNLYPFIAKHVKENRGNSAGSHKEHAVELLQEVLVIFFRRLREESNSGKPFVLKAKLSTYLIAVGQNTWSYWSRGFRRHVYFEDQTSNTNEREGIARIDNKLIDTVNPEQEVEQQERKFLINKALSSLDEDCRNMLSAYAEGQTTAQISKIQGYQSDNTTLNALDRCKKKLLRQVITDSRSTPCGKILYIYYGLKKTPRQIYQELNMGSEEVVREQIRNCMDNLKEELKHIL